MDRSSILKPSRTRMLCDNVKRKIILDNAEYSLLKKAVVFLTDDKRLKGSAYESLKKHLSEYELVLDSLIKANDFISLQAGHMKILVGDEEFIGQEIFDRIDELSRKIENARQNASYWAHDHVSDPNPGPNPYDGDVADYTALRDLEYAKIERFDAIDAATTGMYTEAEKTIAAVKAYIEVLSSRASDGININLGKGLSERNNVLINFTNLSERYVEESKKKVANNYAEIRQKEIEQFWLTSDIFEDPYWYQDETRRELVYQMFRDDLELNGPYEMTKPGELSAAERLIRERKMVIIRYMANSLKGEAFDRMLDDFENMCSAYGVDYYDVGYSQELGHIITPELFDILIWNEKRKIGREFGHWCDRGGAEIIDGIFTFADGATFDPANLGNTPVEDLTQAIIQQEFDIDYDAIYFNGEEVVVPSTEGIPGLEY